MRHHLQEHIVTAYSSSVKEITAILSANQSIINDIEINKGSLNDVFIAITGKEIRE
jgi:ABC-2 type transport system ATP-binding protein